MATQNDNGMKTYTTSEAIGQYIRVKLSSGLAAIAGAGEESIGTTQQSVASGSPVTVKLDNAPGTQIVVSAAATVASGGNCYQAASGTIASTINGRRVGINTGTATSTSAGWFEMLPTGVNS